MLEPNHATLSLARQCALLDLSRSTAYYRSRRDDTLDAAFCIDALAEALEAGAPEIFNTDQGSQFTGHDFAGRLDKAEVRISMDGRGRCFDNGRSAASP